VHESTDAKSALFKAPPPSPPPPIIPPEELDAVYDAPETSERAANLALGRGEDSSSEPKEMYDVPEAILGQDTPQAVIIDLPPEIDADVYDVPEGCPANEQHLQLAHQLKIAMSQVSSESKREANSNSNLGKESAGATAESDVELGSGDGAVDGDCRSSDEEEWESGDETCSSRNSNSLKSESLDRVSQVAAEGLPATFDSPNALPPPPPDLVSTPADFGACASAKPPAHHQQILPSVDAAANSNIATENRERAMSSAERDKVRRLREREAARKRREAREKRAKQVQSGPSAGDIAALAPAYDPATLLEFKAKHDRRQLISSQPPAERPPARTRTDAPTTQPWIKYLEPPSVSVAQPPPVVSVRPGHDYRATAAMCVQSDQAVVQPLPAVSARPGHDYRTTAAMCVQSDQTQNNVDTQDGDKHAHRPSAPLANAEPSARTGHDYRTVPEVPVPATADAMHYAVAREAPLDAMPGRRVTSELTGWRRQPYFFGSCSRDNAEKLLLEDGRPGVFMIRQSSNASEPVLSFVHDGAVRHSRIRSSRSGKFYLGDADSQHFDSVEDLIACHYSSEGSLCFIYGR